MLRTFFVLLLALGLPALASAQGDAVREDKIPITSASEEARGLYIEARDMAEKLRARDARPVYDQAIAADPTFALAYYGRALAAATNADFFANLEKAMANVDEASEGEQLLIRALDAGVRGEPDEQLQLLQQLVETHPNDERAHNALAGAYIGRQEYEKAIAEFERATEIDPEYSSSYNNLGYAQRAVGNYAAAEEAFKRYIELIPDDPNPHDSYAELLMKMGRHDESIAEYRAALAADPEFTFSYVGIATNQMLMGQGDAARTTLQELYDKAPDSGVRRQALINKATSYLHEGNIDAAMAALGEAHAIAEGESDWLAVSGDHQLMGDVQLFAGNADEAAAHYAQALESGEKADVPEGVKAGIRKNDHFNKARVALAKGDVAAAETGAAAYHEVAGAPFEVWQDHELMGRIALAKGDAATALTHFEASNQQNPEVLYAIAEAQKAAGDAAAAREAAERAANFNQLGFAYGYIRPMAQAMVSGS
ncbi:MAG: tetratricopeptide repeat protein [Gemmatimonadota bacterium]